MINTTEIKQFIDEDKASTKKLKAKKGLDYYNGRHDIKDYRVFYYDENGELQEDKTRSNERISHPFFTELVDQSTQYLLSGKEEYVKSDLPELQEQLNSYFDDDFKMELNDLLTYTSAEGQSYLYRYINKDFKTAFKFADGLNVVEAPSKYTSDGADYVIYYYYYKTDKDNHVIDKVEVWDDKNVYFYEMIDGSQITIDKERKTRPHVLYQEGNQQYYDTFGDIPFLRLDNNRKQTSDLEIVKDLIDDYDLMACGLSNNIQDVAEGIYVIKGYNGNDLSELTYNIKTKKQVAVGEGGDLDIKTIDIPYQARQTKLELDEKNIYRFGMGLDSSKTDGSNLTNVVIKSRYALLDLKTNKKEMQLRKLMKKVVQIVLDEINAENKTGYTLADTYIEFERVVPSNELDNANIALIEANKKQVDTNTILNVATKLDNDTVLQCICEILELDYEEIKEKAPETDQDVDELKAEVSAIPEDNGSEADQGNDETDDEDLNEELSEGNGASLS